MSLHRCTDTECPLIGQRTDRGCRCHRTDEQVLVEQRDELLAALLEARRALMFYEWFANPKSGWASDENKPLRAKVDAALANAGAAEQVPA